jgi:phosphoribosylaminoimidazole-succinocarboxamide synthase
MAAKNRHGNENQLLFEKCRDIGLYYKIIRQIFNVDHYILAMTDYSTIDLSQINMNQPFYRGSVQNLYAIAEHKDLMISETTSGGSVFDVGTVFRIANSDTARAGFRHFIYTKLANPEAWQEIAPFILKSTPNASQEFKSLLSKFCQQGANTHHLGMIDQDTGQVFREKFPPQLSHLTLIKKFSIPKPTLIKSMNASFYDYLACNQTDNFVIPLEYIMRFGVTGSSSILRKFQSLAGNAQQDYLTELGVNGLTAWTIFQQPIVDFTTKYEPEDRNISKQEAALISSVTGNIFSKSMMLTYLASYLVRHTFHQLGLFLWDLKWEIAKDNDQLVIVDTLDTDSVRATLKISKKAGDFFVHFNKQSIRDYYRIIHADWYNSIVCAKQVASQQGKVFTEVLKAGQADNIYPQTPTISPTFLSLQARKFALITRFILATTQCANDYQAEALEIAHQEIDYYLNSDYAEAYKKLSLNA